MPTAILRCFRHLLGSGNDQTEFTICTIDDSNEETSCSQSLKSVDSPTMTTKKSFQRRRSPTTASETANTTTPPGCVAIKSVGPDGSLRVTMLLVGAQNDDNDDDKYVFLDRRADGSLSSTVHHTGSRRGYMNWDTLRAFERIGQHQRTLSEASLRMTDSRSGDNYNAGSSSPMSNYNFGSSNRSIRNSRPVSRRNRTSSNSSDFNSNNINNKTINADVPRSMYGGADTIRPIAGDRESKPDLSAMCLDWLTNGNLPLSGYLEALEVFSGWA